MASDDADRGSILSCVNSEVPVVAEPPPEVVVEDPVVVVNERPADDFDRIDESMSDLTADFDDVDTD